MRRVPCNSGQCLAVLASKHVSIGDHPHLLYRGHRPPLDFWAEFALLDNLSPSNAEELVRILLRDRRPVI